MLVLFSYLYKQVRFFTALRNKRTRFFAKKFINKYLEQIIIGQARCVMQFFCLKFVEYLLMTQIILSISKPTFRYLLLGKFLLINIMVVSWLLYNSQKLSQIQRFAEVSLKLRAEKMIHWMHLEDFIQLLESQIILTVWNH